jgi:hypothetical protein
LQRSFKLRKLKALLDLEYKTKIDLQESPEMLDTVRMNEQWQKGVALWLSETLRVGWYAVLPHLL